MTAARKLIPIDVVVQQLAARAPTLCAELLPDGRKQGPEWVAPSRWGGSRRSLSVHLTGSKAGVWADFAADKRGDALNLVAEVLFGGDVKRAFGWACSWLGLDDGRAADVATLRRQAEVTASRRAEEDAEATERRRRQAVALWLGAEPIAGTPADAYLRARGIRLDALGKPPAALRFAPACWCAEAGAELPAMVAAIADAGGRHIATHRTYLAERPDADGVLAWRKAPLRDPKMTLGPMRGGFIRLSRGAGGRPWRELRADDTVAFAEGIETALSVALLVPEWRVAAAVSLSNLAALSLPPTLRRVVICADNDPPNSAAVITLKKAIDHLTRSGREVRVARPEPGIKDWNDALRQEAGAE